MKPHAQSRPDRELSRLKERLTLVERQMKIMLAAHKAIVRFESARASVFETEVQYLQNKSFLALLNAENLERKPGKKLQLFINEHQARFQAMVPIVAPLEARHVDDED